MRNFYVLTDALEYMENNICEDFSIQDVADYCHVSLSSLQKLFRIALNISLKEYILKRRICLAARDILESDMLLLDIALKYQFSTADGFTRAFKRVWNETPSEFRKRRKYTEIFPKINYCYREGEDTHMAGEKVDGNRNLNWEALKKETPEWFRDAKFGLFFHYGPYSVPAYKNEWYSRNMYAKKNSISRYHVETYGKLSEFGYKDFYPMLTGDKFDPEEWAEIVERSGARYAGPVTEHADNFSMWDSQVNEINCVNYGPKRDIVGECARAFRKRGIRFLVTFHHQWLWGWFMSTDPEADVYDPANEKYYWKSLSLETNRYLPYRMPDEEFNTMWLEKIKEVMDKYHPDAVYFDSRTCIIDENFRKEMVDYVYKDKPDLVLTYKQEDFPADIGVCDIECGQFEEPKEFPWQTDDRLEDNVTWCMVQNPKYKSARRIVHQLCDIVSKNGNLLLNVGPYADGSFHPDAKAELFKIGDWLKVNGEAIYGTRPFKIASEGPTKIKDANYDVNYIKEQLNNGEGNAGDIHLGVFTAKDFRFTQTKDAVYAIAFGWPMNGQLRIKAFKKNGFLDSFGAVSMLGYKGELTFSQEEDALVITLPEEKPCDFAYVIKLSK